MEIIVYIIGLVIGIYLISRVLRYLKKEKIRRQKLYLSRRVKAKADRKLQKLLYKFKREYERNPTKSELFRLIINASHITIRRRGSGGHFGRQKVRKHLLEKYHVVKEYVMR